MVKEKYKDMKGNILELTQDEFINMSYNSKLTKMDSVDYKKVEKKVVVEKESEDLKNELINEAGLSQKRANKIVAKYPNRDELIKNLDKDSFDKIENEALKEYFKRAKRIKRLTEDILDDGKLNYSNDPSRKSPGRKKEKR